MARTYKRGNIWYADLFISGKRVRRPLSTEKRIAEEKLGELVKHRNANRYSHAPSNVTWKSFCDQYIARSKVEKARNTWENEIRAFRNISQICPIQKLSQMTPYVLEKFKSDSINQGRGVYAINRDMRDIVVAMHKAEAWGYIARQQWSRVKTIKVPKGRLHYFSDDDLRALRKVCGGMYETILYLGAQSGLRRSEMVHLEWADVDFERNRIHIAPKEDWTPKDYERRWIPMSKDLRAYLLRLSAKKNGPFVLGKKILDPDYLTMRFNARVKRAQLEKGSIHTLRHTFASRLVMAGVPLYTVSKMLGHSNIKTTAIYSHLSQESITKEIEKLPALV